MKRADTFLGRTGIIKIKEKPLQIHREGNVQWGLLVSDCISRIDAVIGAVAVNNDFVNVAFKRVPTSSCSGELKRAQHLAASPGLSSAAQI